MQFSDIEDLVQPLSTRSVLASTLLGTYPPRMAAKHLVAFGQRFGITPGTTRVALSRMVERGELTNVDGVYELAGELKERQHRQDASREEPTQPWDQTWEQAIVVTSGRSAAERNQLRRDLESLKLAELREGCWMRPANLAIGRSPLVRSRLEPHVCWFSVSLPTDEDASALAKELFSLEQWATQAETLKAALGETLEALSQDDAALVNGFMLAAATLRHFVHDPQLPAALLPQQWPGRELLHCYNDFQAAYSKLLRDFFKAASQQPPSGVPSSTT